MTTNTAALVQQLRNALNDARDDVQAELQRCTELAGRPSTDRRLAFQEQQAKDVDAAIAAADQWLESHPVSEAISWAEKLNDEWRPAYDGQPLYSQPVPAVAQPLTDEQINACFDLGNGQSFREFARAIERAHGIGQPAGGTK